MINYSRLSDSELLARVNKYDHIAFKEVYNRFAESLIREAQAAVCDDEKAKDLVQDVFEQLLQKRGKLDLNITIYEQLRASLKAGLLLSVIQQRQDEKMIASLQAYAAEVAQDPEKLLSDKERLEHINTRINQLPAIQRAALELRRNQGLSLSEIARLLDADHSYVKRQLHQAFRMLKAFLVTYILMLTLMVATGAMAPRGCSPILAWCALYAAYP